MTRELLLAKFSDDAANLVADLHQSMKLTFRPDWNSIGNTTKAAKILVARIKAEVKKLQMENRQF